MPGDASLFPDDVLNRDERCVLHFALSNTIWDKFKNGEEEFCNPPPTEKFAGSVPYRYWYFVLFGWNSIGEWVVSKLYVWRSVEMTELNLTTGSFRGEYLI